MLFTAVSSPVLVQGGANACIIFCKSHVVRNKIMHTIHVRMFVRWNGKNYAHHTCVCLVRNCNMYTSLARVRVNTTSENVSTLDEVFVSFSQQLALLQKKGEKRKKFTTKLI